MNARPDPKLAETTCMSDLNIMSRRIGWLLWLVMSAVSVNVLGMPGGAPCQNHECIYFAKSGLTNVYEQPSKSSPIIFTFEGVGHRMHVQQSLLRTSPNGWFVVEGNFSPEVGVLKKYKGWIALDSVVSEDQLKPVKACWPFSDIESEEGDFGITIKAKQDGSFVANSDEKGHIYYHDGIGLFWADTKGTLLEIGYDPSTRSLTAEGDITKLIRFPTEQLQGCGPEPTVEDEPLSQANKP